MVVRPTFEVEILELLAGVLYRSKARAADGGHGHVQMLQADLQLDARERRVADLPAA